MSKISQREARRLRRQARLLSQDVSRLRDNYDKELEYHYLIPVWEVHQRIQDQIRTVVSLGFVAEASITESGYLRIRAVRRRQGGASNEL